MLDNQNEIKESELNSLSFLCLRDGRLACLTGRARCPPHNFSDYLIHDSKPTRSEAFWLEHDEEQIDRKDDCG